MRIKGLGIFFFYIIINVSCSSDSDKNADRSEFDSAEEAYAACYENFFKDLPRFKDSSSAYLLLDSGRKVSMTRFFMEEYMSPAAQYGLKDLDGDGVIELVIYNNSGGAHCCDEYYIFSKKNEKEYDFKSHLMGSGCIDAVTNTLSFSFSETLGYFFGCYACGFSDSTVNFKPMREIRLQYKAGKLVVLPYSAEDEKQNIANLEILNNHGYEEVEGLMDNGWRKEIAMNVAVWHYNHGKDWNRTKKLFDQYYNFQDAEKVWKEFFSTLKESEKENTF